MNNGLLGNALQSLRMSQAGGLLGQAPMSAQNMQMMGMDPNFGNFVGPTSARAQQAMPSQLQMHGMEDQLARQNQPMPVASTPDLSPYFTANPFLTPGFQTMGYPTDEYLTPDRINSLWTQFQADQGMQGG